MLLNPTNRLLFLPLLLFLISVWLASGSPLHGRTFKRPDPLRHFKDYNGDFDVRNKHYVASAAFTGVHGYAFAVVWLLCGVALGIFMMVKCLSGGSTSLPCLDHYYLHIFFFLLVLTSLAMITSSLVLVTSQKTLRRTEKLKESVVGIGEDALGALDRVIKTTKQMQYLLLPYNPQISASLNSTTEDLRTNSRVIRRFIDRSGQSFDKATHTSFADDACTAFEDFEKSPQNSSLGSMLPCINDSFSGTLIAQIGNTVHNFIVQLNSNMSVIYRLLGVGQENEELIGVKKICDPFSGAPNYTYIPQSCPQDAIRIGDLPKILASFTCHEEDTAEECREERRFLPQASYNMAHAYSRSIQDLLDIYPDLQKLSKCTIVKNKVAEIVLHQCRPIRISTRLLWSSMLALSIIMVVLVLTWVTEALRCWQKPLSKCFRTPRSR